MQISIAFFVLALVSVVILGPIIIGVTYSLRKRHAVNNRELEALQSDIAQIKADIADIKDQFADFIIRTH